MRSHRAVLWGCISLTLLFGSANTFPSGIVCQFPQDAQNEACRYLLIAGITEEPDPLGAASGPAATGVQVGAGTPQVVTSHGMTVAVWADGIAGNRDIIFSEWRPSGWHQQPLTTGGVDEVGPSVTIAADGTIYVAWWETQEPRRTRVARRDPVTLRWVQPAAYAGMQGSRPSILVQPGGEVLIAYERRPWTGGREVVIRRVPIAGGPVEEVLAKTSREDPLVIQLHLHGSLPYIDWIHRDNLYGYSEFRNGRWGASLNSRPLTQRAGGFYVEIEPLAPTP